MRSALLLLALAAILVATAPGDAAACSCATAPAADRYHAADAAVIGTVISDDGRRGRIRVEEDFKAELGPEVEVPTDHDSGLCGLDLRPGQELALFLHRRADGWAAGACDYVDPDELWRAAGEPPPALGSGTAVLLAYGKLGDVRLAALDAEGRPLTYGRGSGETFSVAVCPGSRLAVEWVTRGETEWIAVRRLRDMAVLRERRAPWRGELFAASCRDPEARRLVFALAAPETDRIVAMDGGRPRTLLRRRIASASPLGDVAIVGDRRGALLLDLDTGARRRLRGVRGATGGWSASPDGKRAVATEVGIFGAPAVVVARLDRRAPVVRRVLNQRFAFEGTAAWLDDDRVVVGGDDQPLRMFDRGLRFLGAFPARFESLFIAVAAGRVYAVDHEGHLEVAAAPDFRLRELGLLPARTLGAIEPIPGGTQVGAR